MPHLKMWEIMRAGRRGPVLRRRHVPLRALPAQDEAGRAQVRASSSTPASPVPADDDLADRVWQAAVEFFLEVGVHNVDTHRRIMISEAELNEALYLAPEQHIVGAGHETRLWRPRRVEDERAPFCIFSPDITYDEDIFLQASMAYVQEPLADGVCGPILEESMGGEHRLGHALGDGRRDGARHAAAQRGQARRPAGALLGRGGHRPVRHRSGRRQQRRVGRALPATVASSACSPR